MIMAKLCAIELSCSRWLCCAGVAARGQRPAATVERHLANVKQLTSGGENAEAYFSPDGKQLIYQTNPGAPGTCDQIFTMNVDGSNKRQIEQGRHGRPADISSRTENRSCYASTHLGSAECPPARVTPAATCGRSTTRTTSSARRPTARIATPYGHARVRRRSHDRTGRPHRLYQRSRWRHGDLFDERRRFRRAAPDEPSRAGRRPVVFTRRQTDRV